MRCLTIGAMILTCCSGGSSADDGIKTPGEDCDDEAAADDPWCDGEKNACVDNTCRLPCDAAGDCNALLNHRCCEVDLIFRDSFTAPR